MALNTFPCNPYPISTEELNKGKNDDLNARVATLEETVTTLGGDVTDLNSNKANQITVAPFFNAETAYEVGDLVYYNGLSYRCTNAHEGEWDADDFAATTIANELDTLKSGLTNLDSEVNGDATVYPYADVITIPDAVPANLADCNVKIEPVQDLHGYDKPWAGGAGKNKFITPDLATFKSLNTAGTWSNNEYTFNGVTYTVITDNDGNVTGINANGTATGGLSYLFFATNIRKTLDNYGLVVGNSYIFTSGLASDVSDVVMMLNGVASNIEASASGRTFTVNSTDVYLINIRIYTNTTANNVLFKPMIRLSTETDTTFAPYTNICPISGHTEASVTVVGDAENPTVTKTYTIALGDTIYGGTVDFDSGVMTVTHGIADINDFTFVSSGTSGGGLYRAAYDGAGANQGDTSKCSVLERQDNAWFATEPCYSITNTGGLLVYCTESTESDFVETYADLQIVYPLATPFTIQLTPQQIQLLKGTNTLTASTGQISVTVKGVSGAIGAMQEQVNATDEALADIAEKLPTAPTTDGAYVLTVTVVDGTPTYSWESAS